MAKPDPGKLWLALSTTGEIALAVTLNKYSAMLPTWAILLLWSIPFVLLLVWVVKEEKSKAFVAHFWETPISYCLMLFVLVPFAVYTTRVVWAKITTKMPASSAPQAGANNPPQAKPVTVTPPPPIEVARVVTRGAQPTKSVPSQVGTGNSQVALSSGATINQSSSSPLSPNIVGNNNQVAYTDTSELPVLSEKQIEDFKKAIAIEKPQLKVVFQWSMEDREAGMFGNDLYLAAKDEGWNTDYSIQTVPPPPFPITVFIAVKTEDLLQTPETKAITSAVSALVGHDVPVYGQTITAPDKTVIVHLISHPTRRPK